MTALHSKRCRPRNTAHRRWNRWSSYRCQFGGWTDEGRLCHPTFRVIRNDTLPPEVVLEVGHDNAEMVKVKIDHPPLRRTHPDTVLFPEPELTKLKLVVYYTEIAD